MSARTVNHAGGWRVQTIASRTTNISHALMVVAPGCPAGPHPQRWCACKPVLTHDEAAEYIAEQVALTKDVAS
jgi:hypothetical protein